MSRDHSDRINCTTNGGPSKTIATDTIALRSSFNLVEVQVMNC